MEIACTIDNLRITVNEGSTILQAAEKAGIHIPALCNLEGYPPYTSCMICVVQDKSSGRLLPSCSVRVEQGMVIETASDTVFKARQDALNMLLCEHVGECLAPCTRTCPAHPDLPGMIRSIKTGSVSSAFSAIQAAIPFPSITGHICPAPCEMACRRGGIDESLSIKLLEKYTGEMAAGKKSKDTFSIPPETGKRVAVIGAGPAGFSAALYIRLKGHSCTLFEKEAELGGQIRKSIPAERLPGEILDRELAVLKATGVTIKTRTALGADISLDELRAGYDAIVLAVGKTAGHASFLPEIICVEENIHTDRVTLMTGLPGVFACGGCVRPMNMAIRAMTDGCRAASMVDLFLRGKPMGEKTGSFNSMVKKYTRDELTELLKIASPGNRVIPAGGGTAVYTKEESEKEAGRCLHCDCHKIEGCFLRKYAREYDADQRRYEQESRKVIRRLTDHPSIIFEPGKCIKCGRCVRLTEKSGHGFCFTGRGRDVDIAVPFDLPLQVIDEKTAVVCARVCPTGALAFKENFKHIK